MVSLAKRFWSSARPGATGAVDVMIDVRGNFFYNRTVPCQLWFFDRAKERDATRRDFILMLDARGIYRKVTRAIVDFSPEQQQNIAAIVWLYRGQREHFRALVQRYLQAATDHAQARKPEPDNTALHDAREALRLTRYFIRQADWLQQRFPDAELVDVPGLVKRVSRTEVAGHDGSLTPGRYVGVAPEEVDEDFDFEETMRAIHIDLRDLNEEAARLAAVIARNFQESGA